LAEVERDPEQPPAPLHRREELGSEQTPAPPPPKLLNSAVERLPAVSEVTTRVSAGVLAVEGRPARV
jgi:hypothetical protein